MLIKEKASPLKLATRCVHEGDRNSAYGAVVSPICLSTSFLQNGPGGGGQYDYGRASNPTREALEHLLAEVEGAKHATAFSSGCAAFTAFLLTLKAGDHLLVSEDVYSGTYRLIEQIFAPFGLTATYVDMTKLDVVRESILPSTRAIWAESPSNPLLRVYNISALAEIANQRKLIFGVDNTFATPVLQQPLSLGAHLVLHSTTKFLNGHSDVIGGALITDDDVMAAQFRLMQRATGAIPSPFDCYSTIRGIKTLPLRVERQSKTCMIIAAWLNSRTEIEAVNYPGLEDDPGYAVASKQMKAAGAVLSFSLKNSGEGATLFLKNLKIFRCAISLGAVESLAEHPATMTHASVPKQIRHKHGIDDGLVRLSIGIEDVEDLIADLKQALESISGMCNSHERLHL